MTLRSTSLSCIAKKLDNLQFCCKKMHFFHFLRWAKDFDVDLLCLEIYFLSFFLDFFCLTSSRGLVTKTGVHDLHSWFSPTLVNSEEQQKITSACYKSQWGKNMSVDQLGLKLFEYVAHLSDAKLLATFYRTFWVSLERPKLVFRNRQRTTRPCSFLRLSASLIFSLDQNFPLNRLAIFTKFSIIFFSHFCTSFREIYVACLRESVTLALQGAPLAIRPMG